MSDARHWLKPAKAGYPTGRHVLLYVQEKQVKGRIVPGRRTAWCADVKDNGWHMSIADSWSTVDKLDALLDNVTLKKGDTTIWLMRGWSDLVLSGLVELMDANVITWRYVSLSGRSCMVKGQYRGRKITITSLTNWTGNVWDGWGDCSNDRAVQRLLTAIPLDDLFGGDSHKREQYNAVCALAAIVATCNVLAIKRIPPTSGAAGILLWRSWLGKEVPCGTVVTDKRTGKRKDNFCNYIAPIPSRTDAAAAAERHVCYALATKQLRIGTVQGPIYCLDLRSAYLIGMCMTPLPLVYDSTLHKPKIQELASRMSGHTGLALVRVQTDEWYYPARVNGKVVQCNGRYWTWLAGAELVHALCSGHIAECWCAHLWHAWLMPNDNTILIDMIKSSCDKAGMCSVADAWRSVYSSLVGRFAGWERVWEDSPAHAGFGRWAQWLQATHTDGVVVPHRSVAGKVQYLAEKRDKQDSVPLLFGCVTAMTRWIMQKMATIVGYEHVYAIAADSVWLDQDGYQSILSKISSCGLSPDNIRVKDIYDRVWMNGRSVVVTERNGTLSLRMPGISKGAAIDSKGRVVVEHTDDWDSDGEPMASKGIRRRKHVYTAAAIVEKYGFPARAKRPGETVNIPLLGKNLLSVLRGERTIEDA